MSLVVLQPCAAAISKKHYEDTIKSPVHLEKVAGLLEPSDVDRLSALYPSGKIPLWGAKPGENNQHVAKWQRMRPGDIILFAKNNEFFTLGVITYLLRSSAAATQLWGTAETANGITQTWECMFAIDELRTISIPVTEINRVVDRKPNANVQEFQVLPQDKSDAVLEYLDMVGNAYAPVPDEPAYENDIEDPDFAQMEFMVEAVRRAEQAFLRKSLFPGDTAHCAICNREFPVRFLVAGHIKRRAACTDAQKRDYFNVVMPNCTFGCDSLFGEDSSPSTTPGTSRSVRCSITATLPDSTFRTLSRAAPASFGCRTQPPDPTSISTTRPTSRTPSWSMKAPRCNQWERAGNSTRLLLELQHVDGPL
jgi:hypothetical protein